jgi:phosphoribosylanthranilate isomerase
VKVCGLTRLADVLLARRLGAWALGFVFAPSPRRLTPAAARRLIAGASAARPRGAPPVQGGARPGAPLAVGVFGDESAEHIARTVAEVGLDGVQLHGLSGPGAAAVRAALAGWERPLLIIQAVPVGPEGGDPSALRSLMAAARREADLVLLDTGVAGRFGGTGIAFPWGVARQAGEGAPFLVAGGIDSENVLAALAESGAWGADVSSGIEVSPGIKDARLMERLLDRVGALGAAASHGSRMGEQQEGPAT